jgi:hypothetical protein
MSEQFKKSMQPPHPLQELHAWRVLEWIDQNPDMRSLVSNGVA